MTLSGKKKKMNEDLFKWSRVENRKLDMSVLKSG